MMRTLLVTIAVCIICVSCGVKGKPEYKSESQGNLKVYSN